MEKTRLEQLEFYALAGTRRADSLRFAARAAAAGEKAYRAAYDIDDSYVIVTPLPPVGGPQLPACFRVNASSDLRVGMIIDVTPAEWQDALLAALTELAAGEDAALAASEPAAAWQDDAAEHLTPAHDPRDGIDRIEGQRMQVRVGKDIVPVSVAEARAMGDACFPAGM